MADMIGYRGGRDEETILQHNKLISGDCDLMRRSLIRNWWQTLLKEIVEGVTLRLKWKEKGSDWVGKGLSKVRVAWYKLKWVEKNGVRLFYYIKETFFAFRKWKWNWVGLNYYNNHLSYNTISIQAIKERYSIMKF